MRYNGVEVRSIHRAIRIGHQAPPGRSREHMAIETGRGSITAGWLDNPMELTATVSIAGRSPEEGEEAYLALCSWARGDGGTHPLEPTYLPGMAYDAALKEITQPDWRRGFGTAEVTWVIANPHPYTIVQDTAGIRSGTELGFRVGGTAETELQIEVTPESTQSSLTLQMDGVPFFCWLGTVYAGSTLRIDMAKGVVTIDNQAANGVPDVTVTNYDLPLAPGAHKLTCGATGAIGARWHKRWA